MTLALIQKGLVSGGLTFKHKRSLVFFFGTTFNLPNRRAGTLDSALPPMFPSEKKGVLNGGLLVQSHHFIQFCPCFLLLLPTIQLFLEGLNLLAKNKTTKNTFTTPTKTRRCCCCCCCNLCVFWCTGCNPNPWTSRHQKNTSHHESPGTRSFRRFDRQRCLRVHNPKPLKGQSGQSSEGAGGMT